MTFAIPSWNITSERQSPNPDYAFLDNWTQGYKPGFMFEGRPMCAGYRKEGGLRRFLMDNPDAQKVSYAEGLAIIREDS